MIDCSVLAMSRYYHFAHGPTEQDIFTQVDLPAPIAVDLNGDGKPEVLAAKRGGSLVVLAPRPAGDGFAAALELSDVDVLRLMDSNRSPGSLEIKTFEVGYLQPRAHDLVHSPRKAVVGVLSTEGDLLLLDHNLRLLWSRKLENFVGTHWHVAEAALLITEHAVNKGDTGLVIVGVRGSTARHDDDVARFLENELSDERAERAHQSGRQRAGAIHEVEKELDRHFSLFAYSGDSGKLRWSHQASDFHKDLLTLEQSTVPTQAHLHMAAQLSEGVHYGEASCRNYREAVLRTLPHWWTSAADTHLRLAYFRKHRSHSGALKHSVGMNINKERLHQGMHAAPNVVVAHVEDGIEAVHLFSGRTICRLTLGSGALHADLNGDGIPDQVHAVGGSPGDVYREAAGEDADASGSHHRPMYCAAAVSSGIPPRRRLWNGTLCGRVPWGLQRSGRIRGEIHVAPPITLPNLGRSSKRREGLRQKSDVLFLTSRGDLTSYNAWGDMRWQVYTGITWGTKSAQGNEKDKTASRSADVPTLAALPLRRHAIQSVVLVAGEAHATIISEHGHEIASFHLPTRPIRPLIPLDFNLDGYTDIILMAEDGLYSWTQVRRPGAVSFAALVGGLIVTMLAVFITQQGFMQHLGMKGGLGKGKGRSTDRID